VAFRITLLTYVEVSPHDTLAAVKFTRGGVAQLYFCVRQGHALKFLGNGNNTSVTSAAYCTDLGSSLLPSELRHSQYGSRKLKRPITPGSRGSLWPSGLLVMTPQV
jgi:hypothetical protein